MAEAKKLEYVAEWRIDGIGGKVVELGSTVKLTEEDAAPFVTLGCLKLKKEQEEK